MVVEQSKCSYCGFVGTVFTVRDLLKRGKAGSPAHRYACPDCLDDYDGRLVISKKPRKK